jgi:response regulator RpfG family c-di-GMP phosphodiesterase
MKEASPLKRTVLIVDDDPGILGLLRQKLRLEGFDCSSCSSGEAALELMSKETFDVIISDLQMPGISGLELLERIHKKCPRSAFLMATGMDDVRVGVQAMKQGADDYLVKPFQLEAVVASVQRALEKKCMELELENYRHHLEEMVEERTNEVQAAIKRIERTYDDTLEALAAALDLRDNETAGHSRRVTRYSLEMAKKIGCSGKALTEIVRGAHLHDIGKIGIPDAILLKPSGLTPREREVMKTHPRIGYELVSRVDFLAPAAEIVLTHQERYDGTGYPQGLQGQAIPLGSRIFALADTLDAMTSDRPYRRALPLSTAWEEIKRGSGRQFDPEVVHEFIGLPKRVWANIRREAANLRLPRVAPKSIIPELLSQNKPLHRGPP